MAKVVRIQSKQTICVTPGLQCKDISNPDAHIPDRLKVAASWPKARIMIKEGVFNYPAEIVDWHSVKRLEEINVITIGAITDSDNPEEVKEAEHLETIMNEIEPKRRGRRKQESTSLEDIASEE